jgi:hypothetical protein
MRPQLARVERLGHIVVGAEVESHDLFGLMGFRGRMMGVRTPPCAAAAVCPNRPCRAACVEHDQVHHFRAALGSRVAVGDDLDLVAFQAQVVGQQHGNVGSSSAKFAHLRLLGLNRNVHPPGFPRHAPGERAS